MKPERDPDCLRVFEMLSKYLDRDLPAGDCDEVRRHVEDCPPCIEFLDGLRRSVDLCRHYRVEDEPAPLDEEHKEKLAQAFERMVRSRTPRSLL